MNHPTEYITTHNLIFGTGHRAIFRELQVDKIQRYYFEGVRSEERRVGKECRL